MTDEPKRRLFVAIELPDDVREAIGELIAPLRSLDGFRWTPLENLHVTLAFVGWVEADAVGHIAARVAGAAAGAVPFEARLGGAGRFPERGRARVLWVGFDDPGGDMERLALGVRATLVGIAPPEERPFRPHVTVARARRPAHVGSVATDAPDVRFDVEAITLFRSRLGGEHARYEPLERWQLGAQPPHIP